MAYCAALQTTTTPQQTCPSFILIEIELDLPASAALISCQLTHHSLQDSSRDIREALHELLCYTNVSTKECIQLALLELLKNLTKYPTDRNSVWKWVPVTVPVCSSLAFGPILWLIYFFPPLIQMFEVSRCSTPNPSAADCPRAAEHTSVFRHSRTRHGWPCLYPPHLPWQRQRTLLFTDFGFVNNVLKVMNNTTYVIWIES